MGEFIKNDMKRNFDEKIAKIIILIKKFQKITKNL